MRSVLLFVIFLMGALATPANSVELSRYLRSDKFGTIKISPTGEYFAATVPLDADNKTILVIMKRGASEVTGTFALGKNTHVSDFAWVNDERILITIAEKFGKLEQPVPTGELYAINADGTRADILVGARVTGRGVGTRVKTKKPEMVAASLIDSLPDDPQHVLISVRPFQADPYTRVEKMHVYSGRRMPVTRAPVRNASFASDHAGEVRFVAGNNTGDNTSKLYYRKGAGADWEMVNDEAKSGFAMMPIGFSADDSRAYLQVQRESGPDAVVAYDVATGGMAEVMRDPEHDPAAYVYRPYSSEPLGVLFHAGKPRIEFFDPSSAEARLYQSLEAAFANPVLVTSRTRDGKVALVYTWSDKNPGDFYLFNSENLKADHLLSKAEWVDPQLMASTRPVRLESRDGRALHGYLTLPADSDGKRMPMVVYPHGGPFGIRDTWGFDGHVQMLAEAGYAVLQVNFRGSGGYGKSFLEAGIRQWGKSMQDDLTDATRWAIDQGIAERNRVCIYGASYGGYAALAGVTREPDLYRCAVGYIGVYDLPMLHTIGDTRSWGTGQRFVDEWVVAKGARDGYSPADMADRVKVPVLLVAGGEDQRAPIEHSRKMERALRAAGKDVETLYVPTEGHGFYAKENQEQYYRRLLGFLARHIGGRPASGDAGSP